MWFRHPSSCACLSPQAEVLFSPATAAGSLFRTGSQGGAARGLSGQSHSGFRAALLTGRWRAPCPGPALALAFNKLLTAQQHSLALRTAHLLAPLQAQGHSALPDAHMGGMAGQAHAVIHHLGVQQQLQCGLHIGVLSIWVQPQLRRSASPADCCTALHPACIAEALLLDTVHLRVQMGPQARWQATCAGQGGPRLWTCAAGQTWQPASPRSRPGCSSPRRLLLQP